MAVAFLAGCGTAALADTKSIGPDQVWTVDRATSLDQLQIAAGGRIEAPAGRQVTLTVNGIEMAPEPGNYAGRVVLTPTADNIVDFSFGPGTVTHRFRQALFVDAGGVEKGKSVEAAAGPFKVDGRTISDVTVRSRGPNFNGVYVAGGKYLFRNTVMDLVGNGDDDFAGFGSGFQTTGKDTRVVLDGGHITVRGATRSAITATNGSNLVVKNFTVVTRDGDIPAGYVPNVDPGKMKAVPWMLGLDGNNRATNLLGEKTRATYINSSVTSENWGALSNDISTLATLTTINSKAGNSGHSGYGTYSLGGATNQFFGSQFDVRDFGAIVDVGGSVVRFSSSSPATVARLNRELDLGLTAAELKAIKPQPTIVNAGRFALFFTLSPVIPEEMRSRPPARVEINEGTVLNAGRAVFLSKGLPVDVLVDGRGGTKLAARSGIIMQVMDVDDPGVHMVNGSMLSDLAYHEPAGPPRKVAGFDLATPSKADVHLVLSHITLAGDFFNGYRDGTSGYAQGRPPAGKNLVIDLSDAKVTGAISATTARHAVDTITAKTYYELGNVTNQVSAAINNGVILHLDHASWTPTGTSYLTALTVGPGGAVTAPAGGKVTMTVDGRPVPLGPGSYKGAIVVTATRG